VNGNRTGSGIFYGTVQHSYGKTEENTEKLMNNIRLEVESRVPGLLNADT
jgi:hypothetical protein